MSEFTKAIAPAIGLVVIDPATSRALPDEGATVQGNAEYWLRRLRDGDVTEVLPPAQVKPSSDTKVKSS